MSTQIHKLLLLVSTSSLRFIESGCMHLSIKACEAIINALVTSHYCNSLLYSSLSLIDHASFPGHSILCCQVNSQRIKNHSIVFLHITLNRHLVKYSITFKFSSSHTYKYFYLLTPLFITQLNKAKILPYSEIFEQHPPQTSIH